MRRKNAFTLLVMTFGLASVTLSNETKAIILDCYDGPFAGLSDTLYSYSTQTASEVMMAGQWNVYSEATWAGSPFETHTSGPFFKPSGMQIHTWHYLQEAQENRLYGWYTFALFGNTAYEHWDECEELGYFAY